jgi:DNA polymerase-4
MRTAQRLGRTINVRFRYDDFERATRARTLSHPTASTEPIASIALEILRAEITTVDRRGLTLIGLSVSNLTTATQDPEQLLLPFGRPRGRELDGVIDGLRERFGHAVVTRASLVGRRAGFEVPKLPD